VSVLLMGLQLRTPFVLTELWIKWSEIYLAPTCSLLSKTTALRIAPAATGLMSTQC
jgi:hypothetical protein